MTAGTFKATVCGVSQSPTRLAVSVRDFDFVIDEPAALGGTDAGPNPVEFVLASFAGCINVVIHMVAKERGVEIRGLRVNVQGELDPSRLMNILTDHRAGFQSIEMVAEIDSDATDEEIDELLRIAETRCPVADNLGNATPISLRRASTDGEPSDSEMLVPTGGTRR